MHAEYLTSTVDPEKFPVWDKPEVAFIGRSNCGKSSLLNALLGRRNLARTSSTPGRTQAINFFDADRKVIFADLPGYGYNKASNQTSKKWHSLMSTYLERPEVTDFLCLTDIRRKFEPQEIEFIRQLHDRNPVTVVLTKSDKINKASQKKSVMKILEQLEIEGIFPKDIHVISSLKKQGLDKLKQHIFATP